MLWTKVASALVWIVLERVTNNFTLTENSSQNGILKKNGSKANYGYISKIGH